MEIEGSGRPEQILGDVLISRNNSTGPLFGLRLDDLPSEPVELSDGWAGTAIESDVPGTLWVADAGFDEAPRSIRLVDVKTGAIVEERDLGVVGGQFFITLQSTRSIDYLSPPTRGIYRYDGSGYRQILPGALVSPPAPTADSDFSDLTGGDRWLAQGRFGSRNGWLWNVRTGERFDLPGRDGLSGPSVAISADGRYLAEMVGGRELNILDLDTGTSINVEVKATGGWALGFIDGT